MMDFSYVAEDPSGATDCTTHGINKDLLYFVLWPCQQGSLFFFVTLYSFEDDIY